MDIKKFESTLVLGLNVIFNVDAVADNPRAIVPSDLLSRDRDTVTVYRDSHEFTEEDDNGQKITTTLHLEIWNTLGCAPVLVLRLQSPDFALSGVGSTPKNISMEECQKYVTAMLDDANIPVGDRAIDSLFKEDLPFAFRNDDDISRPKNLLESEIDSLLIAPADSHRSSIAAFAFSGDPDSTYGLSMATVILVGVQAQRARLNRMAAIWMNGSNTSSDEDTDNWRRQGTLLLQESGLMAMSTRTLAQNTSYWEEEAQKELQLSSDLIHDISDLIPAIQHSAYQDRMQSLEDTKQQKRQQQEDAKAQEEEARRKKEAEEKVAEESRQKDDETRRKLVVIGSAAAFAVTAISLVPAIASLDKDFDAEAWYWIGSWNAWGQTLTMLLIIGMIMTILVEHALTDDKNRWRIIGNALRLNWAFGFSKRKHAKPAENEPVPDGSQTPQQAESSDSASETSRNGLQNAGGTVGNTEKSTSAVDEILDVDSSSSVERNTDESKLHSQEKTRGKKRNVSDNEEVQILIPVNSTASEAGEPSPIDDTRHYIRTRAGMRAEAVELTNGKVRVFRDARARKVALTSTTKPNLDLREKLEYEGILIPEEGSGLMKLSKDYDFLSFAQAAGVILGRSTTGPREWDSVFSNGAEAPANDESDSPVFGVIEPTVYEEAEPVIPEASDSVVSRSESDSFSLESSGSVVSDDTNFVALDAGTESDLFRLLSGNSAVSAMATYDSQTKRMTVHKGATIRCKMTDSLQSAYRAERRQLEEAGMLELSADGSYFVLQRDQEFNSPSMAASVLFGRSSSGNAGWEQEGTNMTLGEVLLAKQTNDVTPDINDPVKPQQHMDNTIWELSGAGDVTATGIYLEDNKFRVMAGAKARFEEKQSTSPRNSRLRKTMIQESILTDQGTYYELVEDRDFDSPSQAAGVFLGRSANGLTEWKHGNRLLSEFLENLA